MRTILLIALAAAGCSVRHEVPPGEMTIRTRAYEARTPSREFRKYKPSGKELRVKSFQSTAVVDDSDHKPFVSRAKERVDRVFSSPEKAKSSNPFLAPWNGVEKERIDE